MQSDARMMMTLRPVPGTSGGAGRCQVTTREGRLYVAAQIQGLTQPGKLVAQWTGGRMEVLDTQTQPGAWKVERETVGSLPQYLWVVIGSRPALVGALPGSGGYSDAAAQTVAERMTEQAAEHKRQSLPLATAPLPKPEPVQAAPAKIQPPVPAEVESVAPAEVLPPAPVEVVCLEEVPVLEAPEDTPVMQPAEPAVDVMAPSPPSSLRTARMRTRRRQFAPEDLPQVVQPGGKSEESQAVFAPEPPKEQPPVPQPPVLQPQMEQPSQPEEAPQAQQAPPQPIPEAVQEMVEAEEEILTPQEQPPCETPEYYAPNDLGPDQLVELLEQGTPVSPFCGQLPGAQFVSISCGEPMGHYLVGSIPLGQHGGFYLVGVPAHDGWQPPSHMPEFRHYLPAKEGPGYWIRYTSMRPATQ